MVYANCLHSLILQALLNKFQRLQNRALNVVYYRSEVESEEEMHIIAKLPSVRQRADKQLLCLMFRKSLLLDIYP